MDVAGEIEQLKARCGAYEDLIAKLTDTMSKLTGNASEMAGNTSELSKIIEGLIDRSGAALAVLTMIVRSNPELRHGMCESIRLNLLNPSLSVTPGTAALLRSMRDSWLRDLPPEADAVFTQPTIRPVE